MLKLFYIEKKIWILPIFLISLELVAQRFYPFTSPYFFLLFKKQPGELLLHTLLPLFRTGAGYFLLIAITEVALLVLPVTRRLNFAARLALTLFLYTFAVRYIFLSLPTSAIHFKNWPLSFTHLCLCLSVVALLFSFRPPRIKRAKLRPPSLTGLALGCLFMLAFLFSTRPTAWERELQTYTAPPNARSPSFFLLSFDAVPGDLFRMSLGGKSTMPLWQESNNRALTFTNAYSVSNSTFTSWFSLLSGRYPWKTGVETLYPHEREGNQDPNDLLPNVLLRAGYRSVFMTDCATTSVMKKEYGFSEIYQLDRGAFRSSEAIYLSTHPLLGIYNLKAFAGLFPDLNSYSSTLYRPEFFFQAVNDKLEALKASEQPFLLAVHSCLTHRDVAKHLPRADSPLLSGLPSAKSTEESELMQSLRWADSFISGLLQKTTASSKPIWFFLFSDHGVRIDREMGKLKYFSHALGEAVNRFQYNIPFEIYSPEGYFEKSERLVSLLDLFPTLTSLAHIANPPNLDGQNLLEQAIGSVPGIILGSAVSTSHPRDYLKTILPLLSSGEFDAVGNFHFSEKSDRYLKKNRSIAYLKLPYRLVLGPEGRLGLYQELSDPYSERNLANFLKKIASQYYEELCERLEEFPCPPSAKRIALLSAQASKQ